jgi:hypothetical protein
MNDKNLHQFYTDRRYSSITEKYPDPKIYPNFYKANRMEYILRPGEMIFIPAGMFHFVHSEDPDPETGLCVAINFWYFCSGKTDEGDPNEKIKFGWHNINFDEILPIIKEKKEIKYMRSETNCFPPSFNNKKFPNTKQINTSFEEFYNNKNKNEYITQFICKEIEKFQIPYKNKLRESALWINWGNCYTIPHYDGMDNWLCQLKGTRRVILVPQDERDLLYTINPYPLSFIISVYESLKDKKSNKVDVSIKFEKSEKNDILSNINVKINSNDETNK